MESLRDELNGHGTDHGSENTGTGLSAYDHSRITRAGGMLYASDLFGGWIGGIAGGVILLPVMGLTGTCLALALLKTTSLLLTVTESSTRQ